MDNSESDSGGGHAGTTESDSGGGGGGQDTAESAKSINLPQSQKSFKDFGHS